MTIAVDMGCKATKTKKKSLDGYKPVFLEEFFGLKSFYYNMPVQPVDHVTLPPPICNKRNTWNIFDMYNSTFESCKFKVIGTRDFQSIKSLNLMDVQSCQSRVTVMPCFVYNIIRDE